MIKKFLLSFPLVGLLASLAFAGKPLTAEAPFDVCTSAFSISVTSFSWTAIPSTQCAGRTGVFINALSTNTGTVRCIPTSSATTPVVSTSTYAVWEGLPSSNAMLIGARDATYLWCLTTNTASETISGVEVKQ